MGWVVTRRAIHVHPQVGPDLPPGLMPDLWGFGAEGDRSRPPRGRHPVQGPERSGAAGRLADLIQRIGKLFG